MDVQEELRVMKAFSDVNRLKVLKLLKEGERCGSDLLENLNISQPTLSHHMKILVNSGVINARVAGKWTFYSINHQGREMAMDTLKEITRTELRE